MLFVERLEVWTSGQDAPLWSLTITVKSHMRLDCQGTTSHNEGDNEASSFLFPIHLYFKSDFP